MKSLKFLTAGVIALAFAGAASAQTYVYLTGSTAFRPATTRAVAAYLGATVTPTDTSFTIPVVGGVGGYVYEGTSGSAVTACNCSMFKGHVGGTAGGALVIIKLTWTGSSGGIQTVSGSLPVRFLPDTGTGAYTFPVNGAGTNSGVVDVTSSGTAPADTTIPDADMADSKQVTTPFNGTFAGHTYSVLNDATGTSASGVGVVPFVWVVSNVTGSSLTSGQKAQVAAGLTNMTPQLAQAQWTGFGTLPLSFYSGNAADSGITIYASGRDPDSGTRTIAYAESGIGVNSAVQQYDAGQEQSGVAQPYASETVNGIFYDVGQGGESSGGKLANTAKMGKAGLANVYVAYMSTGDGSTLVGNSGSIIKYNGIAESNTAVQNGQYTFWSFERLYYRSSLTGTKKSAADGIAALIKSTYSTVLLSSMNVTRAEDGGIVTQ